LLPGAVWGNATPMPSRHFHAVEAQLGEPIGEFVMAQVLKKFLERAELNRSHRW
jgi:hypothetical protein